MPAFLWRWLLWFAHGMTTAPRCSIDPRHLCPEAFDAVRSHDLRWDGNDWVIMSMPRRRTTGLAKWREIGADGDPYVHATCPWCGGDLPMPEGLSDERAA